MVQSVALLPGNTSVPTAVLRVIHNNRQWSVVGRWVFNETTSRNVTGIKEAYTS